LVRFGERHYGFWGARDDRHYLVDLSAD